jgi:UDP-glucose 4-epimerase
MARSTAGTVLVTGGAGYIGSHAAKALRQAGRQVVVYDNLSQGHREAVLGADFVEGDTRDVEKLRSVISGHGVTAVMHFAAFASVALSVRDPVGFYRNNVDGTLSLLEAMAREQVTRFIFSSTCAVFGEPEEIPITENNRKQPINAYGESKLAVERALPHFERAYGIHSISFRYFNAAGADPDGELGEDHEPELHIIPLALDATRGGRAFSVYGEDYPTPDGTCLRDYVHVVDLAQAHLLGLAALEDAPRSADYNLGNGTPYSVREVLAAVERVTGTTVPHAAAPRRDGDPSVLFGSSEKIKRELGWRPRFEDLDTIVRTAWEWRRANPTGYRGQAAVS